MYWNAENTYQTTRWEMINRNMRCIEIHLSSMALHSDLPINRNMRCIEIVARRLLARPYDRLIETWDVLKLILCPQFCCQNMINRNMRCIEISVLCRQAAGSGRINRNMRCIEIALLLLQQCLPMLINRNMRCIEIGNRRHSGGHYRD